jgi:CRISPR-associated protein Cas2
MWRVGRYMETLVVYDIANDKVRNRVAECCKDYGLERIQWSAFRGSLSTAVRREFALRLQRTVGREEGNVQLYPICQKDLALSIEIKGGPRGRRQKSTPPSEEA